MKREDIIERLSKYFKIHELVDKPTHDRFKEDAWQFFETDALHCLLIIREGIGEACKINDWHWGGKFSQSGLRTNLGSIFRKYFENKRLYLSGHVLGNAFDLKFKTKPATEVREWIVNNSHLFPCKIRLERNKGGKPISWTHIDTKYLPRNPKVYLFDV